MKRSLDPSRTEIEASRWIARLSAPDATDEDRRRFAAWRDADPRHRATFEAMSQTWTALGALPRARRSSGLDTPRRNGGFSARPLVLAACAAILLAIGGATVWRALSPAERIVADAGEATETTVLPDGALAELNDASRIRFRFDRHVRRVWLENGEAFFDVPSDPERPFVVETPFGGLRVRGTSFSVRLEPDRARATVVSGVVEALPGARHSARAAASDARDGRDVLPAPGASARANQEIILARRDASVTAVAPSTVTERLAWRSGMIAFDNERLDIAVRAIGRRTGVAFEFADPALGALRVSGYLRPNDLDALEALLQANLGVSMQRVSPVRIRLQKET